MSQTVGNGAKKMKALLQVTMVLLASMGVLMVLLPGVSAANDVVTIKDGAGNALSIVGNNTLATIQVSDGTTLGGTKTATVKENGVANQITVTIYDNGAIAGDTANDKTYVGFFNVTNKNKGGVTSQATGVLAVPDNAVIDVTANLDGDANSGLASVTADFTKPACSIISKLNTYVSGNYFLTVLATDLHIDKVSYQVDSGDIKPTQPGAGNKYTATVDTKNLTEDVHEIEITARDVATNENYAFGNITVDRTAPVITIKPSPKYISATFFLNITVTDAALNESTIQYRLDAQSTADLTKSGTDVWTQTLDLTSEDEGLHTAYVMASDLADNGVNKYVNFTLDRTKAAITINNPAGQVVKDAFILNVTVTDENLAANEVKYKLDGGAAILIPDKGQGFFENTIITAPLTEGSHSLVVTEKDLAGNVNTSNPLTFIVDKTLPNITITSSLKGYYRDKYTLTAEVKDANLNPLQVVYLQNGKDALLLPRVGTTDTFSKEIDVSNWNEMSYQLSVKVTDKATNTKEVGGVTLIIDRTPPSFSYSMKPSQLGYTLDVTVNDANLDPTSVYYTLDGSSHKDFDNIVSNKYTAIIAKANYVEGNHTFVVFATDKAGNVGNRSFIDAVVDPPAQITGLVAKDLFDGKILVSWPASTATDVDHYNLYYRAYDIFTNVSGMSPVASIKELNYTLIGLTIGTRYYIGVTAVDTHGNEDKGILPMTATSKESPKLPIIDIPTISSSKLDKLKAGDSVTFNITVKNTGIYEANQLKIILLDNDNAVGDPIVVSLLSPGSTTSREIYWNADEGEHNLTVEAVLGILVLAKKNVTTTPVHVAPQKQHTEKNNWFNPYYILVIIGVIAGVGVLAFAWRTTKKQDKEIEQQEIELGLRPGKDGKVHRPEDPNAPKPGTPGGPAKPASKHSPDVYIPTSSLLQGPPQQPPATPPVLPPQEPAYQQPPQQQGYQQPPPPPQYQKPPQQ